MSEWSSKVYLDSNQSNKNLQKIYIQGPIHITLVQIGKKISEKYFSWDTM